MKNLPLAHVHRAIEPGPIVLVTTSHAGRINVMTMGFHMVVQHEPPILACVIGDWDHSVVALRATGECVIAVPPASMLQTVVAIGNSSGSEVDKFATYGLTARPAKQVAAPLIAECLVNIECRVCDDALSKHYDVWVLEALQAWAVSGWRKQVTAHHRGDGTFALDGAYKDLRRRMVKWKQFQ